MKSVKYTAKLAALIFIMSPALPAQSHDSSNSEIVNLNLDITFFSESLQDSRYVDIHLPEGYFDSEVSYPVIYFLHGANSSQNRYQNLVDKYRELMADGTIDPAILVKPDGGRAPYAGSFYTSSELYGDIEGYIVNDLQAYMSENYRTDPEKRCVMGHSMGGFGAMKLGFKYSEKYECIISHSAPLDVSKIEIFADTVKKENGSSAPYTYNPLNGNFTAFLMSAAGAFSPNLNNASKVDFIFDSNGELDTEVYERWEAQSPAAILNSSSENINTPVYIDMGTSDEFMLYELNEFFTDTLDKYDVNYRNLTYEGGHSSYERFYIGLAFADSVFKGLLTVSNEEERPEESVPETIQLSQNYPNPFNPSTQISFELQSTSRVKLSIYNLLGQEVATLVDGEVNAGSHSVQFDAGSLPSGMYVYRLEAGSLSLVRKMSLIK